MRLLSRREILGLALAPLLLIAACRPAAAQAFTLVTGETELDQYTGAYTFIYGNGWFPLDSDLDDDSYQNASTLYNGCAYAAVADGPGEYAEALTHTDRTFDGSGGVLPTLTFHNDAEFDAWSDTNDYSYADCGANEFGVITVAPTGAETDLDVELAFDYEVTSGFTLFQDSTWDIYWVPDDADDPELDKALVANVTLYNDWLIIDRVAGTDEAYDIKTSFTDGEFTETFDIEAETGLNVDDGGRVRIECGVQNYIYSQSAGGGAADWKWTVDLID